MVQELKLPISPEEFLAGKQAIFMEMVRSGLQAMPGAVESVERLRDNYALGIGTSLDRDYVDMILKKLGVTGDFSVIVTGDEIMHGKPHPETYKMVMRRMGSQPRESVVLEDAQSGVASAKAAGAWCIGVRNREALPQDLSQADTQVDSLGEVDEDLLHSLWLA